MKTGLPLYHSAKKKNVENKGEATSNSTLLKRKPRHSYVVPVNRTHCKELEWRKQKYPEKDMGGLASKTQEEMNQHCFGGNRGTGEVMNENIFHSSH